MSSLASRFARKIRRAMSISDTFDWHCPRYRDYIELPELESWYEEAGFAVRDVGFPTSALGVKL